MTSVGKPANSLIRHCNVCVLARKLLTYLMPLDKNVWVVDRSKSSLSLFVINMLAKVSFTGAYLNYEERNERNGQVNVYSLNIDLFLQE